MHIEFLQDIYIFQSIIKQSIEISILKNYSSHGISGIALVSYFLVINIIA
jgi:hypothetical protein